MAWISVHTGIDGPKLRDLRKKLRCSKFEATGILVFIWFWGLENAEKSGHILCADKEDIAECISGAGVGCRNTPEAIVDALIETGWIDEVGDNCFYIHDWEIWQEQWYKAKERRESDTIRKRESRRLKGLSESKEASTGARIEPTARGDSKEPDGEEGGEQPSKQTQKYPLAFEEFWKVYPRKADKGMAYKKYVARRKDGFSDEELIEAATAYKLQCEREHTDVKYIKHPKTFLGDSTPFMDYLKKAKEESELSYDVNGNPFEAWGGE